MDRRKPALAVGLVGIAVAVAVCTADTTNSPPDVRTSVALEESFPTEFPLAAGTVVQSAPVGQSGHTVTVEVGSTADQDAALARLTDAGFVQYGSLERDGLRSYSLLDSHWLATVILKEEAGRPVVVYSVAPRA